MTNKDKFFAWIVLTSLLWAVSLSFVNADTGTTQTVKWNTWISAQPKADFEVIKPILDKKRAGTTLTADEQARFAVFKTSHSRQFHWENRKWPRGSFGFKWRFSGPMEQLTDTEKTALQSMTDAQKQDFFDKKREIVKAQRDAKEAVIDKVLNGETLTATEQTLLTTIKKERAERKIEEQKRDAEIWVMKSIFDKVKAGTTLTADEQARLDAFKSTHQQEGGFEWRWNF